MHVTEAQGYIEKKSLHDQQEITPQRRNAVSDADILSRFFTPKKDPGTDVGFHFAEVCAQSRNFSLSFLISSTREIKRQRKIHSADGVKVSTFELV
jgi:hypothetical protein